MIILNCQPCSSVGGTEALSGVDNDTRYATFGDMTRVVEWASIHLSIVATHNLCLPDTVISNSS